MPPRQPVSIKRRAVDAKSHENVAAVSPRETESMALTSITTRTSTTGRRTPSTGSGKSQGSANTLHEASTIIPSMGPLSLTPVMTLTPPSLVSATSRATAAARKRAREPAERSRSGTRHSQGGRSPSAPATTGMLTRPLQRTRCSGSIGSDSSLITGTPQLMRNTKMCVELEEEELFFETMTTSVSSAHLQHTPTSQLLSQQQVPPYSAPSEDWDAAPAGPAVEQALFPPATVARRPKPQTGRGEELLSSVSSAASALSAVSPTASSASRPSSHDEAVQAILRANPPTITRLVQLKPGYSAPSPQTPLWAALDADEDEEEHTARRSGQESEEPLLSNTQISLFQLGSEGEASTSGAVTTATLDSGLPRSGHTSAAIIGTVSTSGVHVPTTMHECRRLGTRAAANGSISLPAPGRSLNLLDEDGLHDDERLPVFVGMDGDSQDDDTDGGAFSLTQEANRQEREHDMKAVLPRSRACRSAAAAQASTTAMPHAGKLGGAGMSTPSPTRQHAARTSLGTAQQRVSPYSQLQRDVERTIAAAEARAANERHATAPAADVKPPEVLSQKELRRRADMLKWAEHTRAFFHFIDARPLHVTTSPPKPLPSTSLQQRRSSDKNNISYHKLGSIGMVEARKRSRAVASMSLVRRSHSASAVPTVPSLSAAAHRSTSSAFEAVISRVKREAAAAAKTPRSTSAK